jgi:hypothetical protein
MCGGGVLKRNLQMKFKDEVQWKEGLAKNDDPYGRGVYVFAEKWANLMEKAMAAGATLTECANQTSHDADTDGITGFMYGCAVSILSRCWEHGETLRRWHNLDVQLGQEGEKANESGGVLNPALLTFG